MDPLSITVSIITLIDVTRKVVSVCQNYQATAKGANWEQPRVIAEVQSLQVVLQNLERIAKQAENGDPPGISLLPQLQPLCDPQTGTFFLCLSELQLLERKLSPPQKSGGNGSKRANLAQALSWPLKHEFVDKTLKNIERFKTTLSLAIGANAIEGISAVQRTANEVQNQVVTLQQDTGALDASFRSMRIDDQAEKALHWLSSLDPSIKYGKALEDRNKKTGKWLLDNDPFGEWKQSDASVLWLFGKPGCGKTILSSTVIEHLLSCRSSDESVIVAYFFIDFQQEETQLPENVVRSLLKQTCQQSHIAITQLGVLYSTCANGTQQPRLDQILALLSQILKDDGERRFFLIVDALDESKEREKLLKMLKTVHEPKDSNLHLLVTSRPEFEIKTSIEKMTSAQARICIESALVQGDITTYIRDRLETDDSLRRFRSQPKIQEEIKGTLAEKSDGMFRWAACQLDSFKSCLNIASLRKALGSLPSTLNQTYERVLCNIDKEYSDSTKEMLYWLTYSARPLAIEELADVMAINAYEKLHFDPEKRFLDPNETLLVCSSLVSVFKGDFSKWNSSKIYVRLGHFSVKEYLISTEIWSGPASKYGVLREVANRSIAQSCLGMLLHFDRPNSLPSYPGEEISDQAPTLRNSKMRVWCRKVDAIFPICLYAAEHWIHHAHEARCGQEPMRGLVSDFFLNRDALENWIQIISYLDGDFLRSTEGVSSDLGPSLYHAAEAGFPEAVKKLIATGANINESGGNYDNALQVASWRGHFEVVSFLLDEGAEVNARGEFYGSALQSASYRGHESIVELLLSAGADVDMLGGNYGTALQIASASGVGSIVKMLLKVGATVNVQAGQYTTALRAAALHGHLPVVEMLLNAGADVNIQCGTWGTALAAAAHGGNLSVVEKLLDTGMDVNIQVGDQGGALTAATHEGHLPVIEKLLNAGADVNVQAGSWGTVLAVAATYRRLPVVEMLLNAGADVNSQAGRWATALAAAAGEGDLSIVEMLLNAGADVNLQAGNYGTALGAAACEGHLPVLEMLLNAGADMNAQAGRYGTALGAAANNGHLPVVEKLLNAGADVNIQAGENGTALGSAARRGYLSTVEMLLNAGADVNLGRRKEDKPLYLTRYGSPKIKQILLEHGARDDYDMDSSEEETETETEGQARSDDEDDGNEDDEEEEDDDEKEEDDEEEEDDDENDEEEKDQKAVPATNN